MSSNTKSYTDRIQVTCGVEQEEDKQSVGEWRCTGRNKEQQNERGRRDEGQEQEEPKSCRQGEH